MADRNVKTEAIVLRSFKYGETDLILTLFGRSTGKISAIAKGARKTRSRMRGTLQLFSQGNYLLYRGKSLFTVTQCETEEPFINLRQNLSKYAYASYCTEIMREILPEEEVNLPAYNLMSETLKVMSATREDILARFFDIRMLKISGYQPELSCCVKCGGPLPERPVFSSLEGGIVCCGDPKGIQVGRDTLAVMASLSQTDIHIINRLKPSPRHLSEMETITRAFWESILDKNLLSAKFIEKMRYFA